MVEIDVEDQGPGIPDGSLEHVFDRFYSERPAGEAFGRHSGLGLSISRQIVEALQGPHQRREPARRGRARRRGPLRGAAAEGLSEGQGPALDPPGGSASWPSAGD